MLLFKHGSSVSR